MFVLNKCDQYQGSISPTCFRTALTDPDPKSIKIQSSCQCLFALLGSALLKVTCKILMKLITCSRNLLHTLKNDAQNSHTSSSAKNARKLYSPNIQPAKAAKKKIKRHGQNLV